MDNQIKVVMLVSNGVSSRIIFHELKTMCDVVAIVEETSVSNKILIKNRIKRLGLFKVSGQIIFMIFSKFLKIASANRINEIVKTKTLDMSVIKHKNLVKVQSINDIEVENILQKYNPDLIIVNGTRIIKANILNSIDKPFVNTHVGITPKYRGVHGAYWALANNDKEHCGVTVHLVDEGIDTGGVLYQSLIEPTDKDNFTAYPYLQTVAAIDLLKQVINDTFTNSLKEKNSLTNISNIWSHPTIYEYISNWITKGIK